MTFKTFKKRTKKKNNKKTNKEKIKDHNKFNFTIENFDIFCNLIYSTDNTLQLPGIADMATTDTT